MKILVISRRDMHREESGGARTVMQVNDYLAAQSGIEVYTSYRHLSPVNPRIIEIPIGEHTPAKINRLIRSYHIDLLLVPESVYFAPMIRQAVENTSCKVIMEFHSCPGYEILELKNTIKQRCRDGKWKEKIKNNIKLALFPLYKSWYRYRQRAVFQDNCLLADRFVVLSPSFIESYRKWYKVSVDDSQNMVAIGNALSFVSEATSEDLKTKENTILVVSRLYEPHKRLSYVFDVWSHLEDKYPDWRLQIIGTGPDEGYYRDLVAQKRLKRVIFEGQQNPESYYTKASVFLMTSACEGWGMTITEALQKGCVPIVMDSFSTVHDLLKDSENGFIVKNKDLSTFSQRCQKLIDDPDLRHRMALQGIESCKQWNMQYTIGPQWIELFRSIL